MGCAHVMRINHDRVDVYQCNTSTRCLFLATISYEHLCQKHDFKDFSRPVQFLVRTSAMGYPTAAASLIALLYVNCFISRL